MFGSEPSYGGLKRLEGWGGQRQGCFVFHLFECKTGTDFFNACNGRELFQDEFFKRGDVRHRHANEVIAVTRHEVALHDFIVIGNAFFKCGQR